MFDALAIAQPHVASGRVRALATTGPRRLAALPGVPTAKETLPEFEVVNWYGMAMRGGTPGAAIARLQQDIAWSLRQPDVAERSASLGLDLVGSTAEEFARFQRAEVAKWGAVIRAADIKSE
jgi:tripartite-type tricarboxylate transporter receptor subunit TctC